jgi:type I restriction enzyme, S subunit
VIDFEELPDAWILTSLSDLVITIQYGYTASAAEQPIGPKFLRITDLQNNSVDWNTVPFCNCDEIEKYKLKKGDIVIARTGATTGASQFFAKRAKISQDK